MEVKRFIIRTIKRAEVKQSWITVEDFAFHILKPQFVEVSAVHLQPCFYGLSPLTTLSIDRLGVPYYGAALLF